MLMTLLCTKLFSLLRTTSWYNMILMLSLSGLLPTECCHLLFSRKRSPTLPVAPLEVNGNFVNQVNEYKYLEVILTSDMSWSSHISAISSRSRKLIGVLYRKFYPYSEPHTLLRLYQSLIHLHLEYACSVWDPHLKKDIERLEGVQKFGLKVCLKQWQCGMRNFCNLPTFQH